MKKLIIYYSVISFIFGFISNYITMDITLYLLLTGLTFIWTHIRTNKKILTSHKLNTTSRTQFWDNIYFFLLSLNLSNSNKELRVWAIDFENITDFTSAIQLTEQIALKTGCSLKMLATHHNLEKVKSLTKSTMAQKVRFSQFDTNIVNWPFKNKFDIIFIGNLDQKISSKHGFHKRLDRCVNINAVIVADESQQDNFLTNSWALIGPGILTKNMNKNLSNSSNFYLRNDLSSNFI